MSATQVWRSIWFSSFFRRTCLSRTLRNTEYQVANAASGSVWLYTLSKGALLRSLKNSLSSNLAKDLYVKRACPTLGIFTPFFLPSTAARVVVADADYWHTGFKDVRDVSWVDMINESFWWRCDPGWSANSLREVKKRDCLSTVCWLLIDQYWSHPLK